MYNKSLNVNKVWSKACQRIENHGIFRAQISQAMKFLNNILFLIVLLISVACDKKETSIEKPITDMSINFSGALNDIWENEDGWFVINQLYKHKDHDQLSITLSKGYSNLSIVFIAEEGKIQPGTYPLVSIITKDNSARAEYYILGKTNIFKCNSGALTITDINNNRVKGFIYGNFSNNEKLDELIVYGSFSVSPLY